MTIVIESNEEHKEMNLSWSDIDWKEVQYEVERLQGRIYIATDKKDFRTVKNLQKLCVRSHFVKLYAIRQVTQINSGKCQ